MKALFNTLFSATERISYRRLTVFATSCALLLVDKLTGEQWVMIAIAYIAGQSAPAMAKAFRG
jgi:hypothetical protein